MSQAGEINVVQNHPEIPTMFVTDSGTAIPLANTLEILTNITAAGTHPIETTGATNVVTINAQKSQALAAADATKIGLSNFSSAHFTVDANGFVDLAGGAVTETLTGNSGGAVGPDGANNINVIGNGTTITIAGNPGTHTLTASVTGAVGQTITGNSGGALAPTAGNWNILGAKTAAGSTPVTTSGAASTLTVDVQTSQAIAASDATKIGLSAFNSAMFSVDANGFVALSGGGQAIDSIGTQTGTNPIAPDATGLVTINGATVLAGTHPVRTDGTGANTMAVEVQISQAIAATDATKIGLAAFNSADFTVDANGFVGLLGTGVLETLTGNSGGAISPTAGNINTLGTGSITIVGSGSTLTTQLTGLTNHNVLIGAGTATITDIAPSATSGVPLISQGAAADPAFGTAVVAGGGTGDVSFTAFAPITGGTTATGALQSASTGQATSGFVFTSTGSGSLPTFQAVSASGAITTITGNSGGAESPSSGNFNIVGTGSITVAGSANTETVQLTGLTNHAIQIGAGTATLTQLAATATTGQVLQNNSGADPSYSTATYPSTTTINQLLYSSSANVVGGLATANNGVLTTGTTGIPVITALASDGQVIIGSGAGAPAAATLSAGTNISITNGHNTITIAATGSAGMTYSDQSGTFAAVANNGYFITAASTPTMPASPSEGDTIIFIIDTASTCTVTGNTGQKLRIGAALSASAGTAANNARGDTVTFVYRSTGTTWFAKDVVGTWTVT